jgi:hypothetical protein
MTKTKDVIAEAKLDTPPGYVADPNWYAEYEKLDIEPPKLVIDLAALTTEPADELHERVFNFLYEHGLDDTHARTMANRLIERRYSLHPSTLGVIVQPAGAGHWQIVAERGQ